MSRGKMKKFRITNGQRKVLDDLSTEEVRKKVIKQMRVDFKSMNGEYGANLHELLMSQTLEIHRITTLTAPRVLHLTPEIEIED